MQMGALETWRMSLEQEIAALEERISPLMKAIGMKREQLKAINVLIDTSRDSSGASTPAPASAAVSVDTGEIPARERSFAPTDAYWIPILESLVERGGRAHSDAILNMVERKMARILTTEDYELLPSGISCRWRNRAQWQRQNMIQQGLLVKNSPRGIWEITNEGRAWLKSHKQGGAAA